MQVRDRERGDNGSGPIERVASAARALSVTRSRSTASSKDPRRYARWWWAPRSSDEPTRSAATCNTAESATTRLCAAPLAAVVRRRRPAAPERVDPWRHFTPRLPATSLQAPWALPGGGWRGAGEERGRGGRARPRGGLQAVIYSIHFTGRFCPRDVTDPFVVRPSR